MHTACPACWLHCPDNEHHEFRKHTYLVHKPIKVDTKNVSDDGYTSFKLDEISDKLDKWLQVQSNKYDKVSGKFDACSFMNIYAFSVLLPLEPWSVSTGEICHANSLSLSKIILLCFQRSTIFAMLYK